ncbi:hypothetical protein HYFRA_00013336 [Hymenoscyphus fraxineus]|uniref:Calcineurin-like phosphoesterase domain-containing protein n=1 Tax=Hymenoscyphus fraxineus TaxID=746836 RepID=A0A9N9PZS6_9HELO|nr:hypothetical protein HYFRA_00013336 [Hymenoscyphus fraxineus]
MRQIQIISDLHLETPKSYNVFEITPSAPYLALIGDIGNAKDPEFFDFITKQLPLFKIVFLLLGNHEPYHSSWTAVKNRIRDFEKKVKESPTSETLGSFVFMDQTRFDLSDDTTIFGCTLYSNITPEQSEHVSFGLNDFYHIEDWTVEDHCKAHTSDLRWLNDQVNLISQNESNRKIIVLTHHSPTISPRSSDPAHSGSRISSGFMSDLSNETCWTSRNVKVWVFGHTHYNCDYVDDGKRVVANQRGYYFKPAEGFDEEKVIEV